MTQSKDFEYPLRIRISTGGRDVEVAMVHEKHHGDHSHRDYLRIGNCYEGGTMVDFVYIPAYHHAPLFLQAVKSVLEQGGS